MLKRTYKMDPRTLDCLWTLADRDGISQAAMLRLLVRREAVARGFKIDTQEAK